MQKNFDTNNVIPFKWKPIIEQVSFQTLGKSILDGNSKIAIYSIKKLLGVPHRIAEDSAQKMIETFKVQPQVLRKMMEVRFLIEAGKNNQALLMITEAFFIEAPYNLIALSSMIEFLKNNSKEKI